MDEATDGLAATWIDAPFDPWQPWWRASHRRDARQFPERGGGRMMRHPFMDPIRYLQVPDRTFNWGYHPLRNTRSILTRTLGGTVVTKFRDQLHDIVIEEAWLAEALSTFSQMAHQFHRYLSTPLPAGRYVGWQPRDLSPRGFFVELLDVRMGQAEAALLEEIGDRRPYLMREQLTVRFKLVSEVMAPSGVVNAVGN